MRQLGFAAIVCAAVGLAASGAQTQQPPPAQTAPAPTPGSPGTPATSTADPYAGNAAPGATQFPLAAPAGKDSNASMAAPPGAHNQGPFDPATWKYGPAFNAAGRRQDLESGEAEADAGRQGDGRHALQRHRSGDLLRDGERRLRLHLDRDAARPARLAGGRAHVAHLSAREGRSGRARRLHRRARNPACARRRRARHRRADRGHRRPRRSRGARTGPTSRRSGGAATAAARRSTRRCGAAFPADTATRSTTTSC